MTIIVMIITTHLNATLMEVLVVTMKIDCGTSIAKIVNALKKKMRRMRNNVGNDDTVEEGEVFNH